jgi:hypothetical protein
MSVMNRSYPEHWFRNVRKFSVGYEQDYLKERALTVVKIYYNSWWKFPRIVRFVHDGKKGSPDNLGERHPEAQALIDKLKQATKCLPSST